MSHDSGRALLAAVSEMVLLHDEPGHDWGSAPQLFSLQRGPADQLVVGRRVGLSTEFPELDIATLETDALGLAVGRDGSPAVGFAIRLEAWQRTATSLSAAAHYGPIGLHPERVDVSICAAADMHGNTHTAARLRNSPTSFHHNYRLHSDIAAGNRLYVALVTCAAALHTLHRHEANLHASISEALAVAGLSENHRRSVRTTGPIPPNATSDRAIADNDPASDSAPGP